MPEQYVIIELDRRRKIRFETNSLCELESVLKLNANEILVRWMEIQANSSRENVLKVLSWTEARAFLWAGFLHEDDTLTLKQVGNLFAMAKDAGAGLQSFQIIATKIIEAIFLFLTGQEGRERIQAAMAENAPANGESRILESSLSNTLAYPANNSGVAVGSKLMS